MLLTIETTHHPATDLGFVLHKHPDRVQDFSLSFGSATVLYPEATEERCTAALVVEVDPISLVRRVRSSGGDFALAQYVNDRPYAASSFLSVALGRVFRSALARRCPTHPHLTDTPFPLTVRLPCLPCRGGERLLRALFEPLGYTIDATQAPLDDAGLDLGMSRYWSVALGTTAPVGQVLDHLYVLLPVLDDEKHYWVDDEEIEKLLRHGEGWLPSHPSRALITERYLKHERRLARQALERISEGDEDAPDDPADSPTEEAVEAPISLQQRRTDVVLDILRAEACQRIVDLGCGEGRLVAMLLKERGVERVVGMDVSARALEHAARRLHLDQRSDAERARVELLQGSLTYRDARLVGLDAAVAIEVIEHLEPHRIEAFTTNLLGAIRAPLTLVSTPNREHNVRFPTLESGTFRHADHRFEWTRAEFRAWAEAAAHAHGYDVTFLPIGEDDPVVGPPTQLAVFRAVGVAA